MDPEVVEIIAPRFEKQEGMDQKWWFIQSVAFSPQWKALLHILKDGEGREIKIGEVLNFFTLCTQKVTEAGEELFALQYN